MSAAFKLAKQKSSQKDLRRLMQEQKQQRSSETIGEKIDSPLAKFENGQWNCQLCKSVVRSAAVWKVHVNGKQHKENLTIAKQLKEKIEKQSKPLTPEERLASLKRSAEALRSDSEIPEKKVKGILKNSGTSQFNAPSKIIVKSEETPAPNGSTSSELPQDFFDTNSSKTSETVDNIKEEKSDDPLPEGFFDDPKKDAKARHQEYRDPTEAEWEKFQKEIKEVEAESTNIINDDYEDEIVERQIEEIDVQMRNWSKVLSLEKKKEIILSRKLRAAAANQSTESKMEVDNDTENDEDEDDDDDNSEDLKIPDFVDWRAKKIRK